MVMDGSNMCLTVGYPGDASRGAAGSVLTTAQCDPSVREQSFTFDPVAGGNIVYTASGRCVDAGHFGQVIQWNPDSTQWSLNPVRANTCPDAGNPPFLPRTSVRDYTVGAANWGQDRLIILDGDEADNNIWTSDDCGLTWNCYDGSNPWSDGGRALAVVIQAPPDIGFYNNPGKCLLFLFCGNGGECRSSPPPFPPFLSFTRTFSSPNPSFCTFLPH